MQNPRHVYMHGVHVCVVCACMRVCVHAYGARALGYTCTRLLHVPENPPYEPLCVTVRAAHSRK